MKKFLRRLLPVIIIFTVIIFLLNVKVTTRQGINYQVDTIRMPLYLKIIDFIDRHYNYKQLVQRIVKDERNEQKKTMKIFSWTYHNIRKQPKDLPVIDDHVWHIIVRGYGMNDQFSDVFTTLCNYAGLDAFFSPVYSSLDKTRRIPLSFVKVYGRWYVFDPFLGNYFKNKNGEIVDIGEIKSTDTWSIESIESTKGKQDIDYADYLDNIPLLKDMGLTRANTQSPLNRTFFEIQKWLK